MTTTESRSPMKPAAIRRRAYALMRQCRLTLLIAGVLMCLFSWVGSAVEAHGEKLALQAYNAHMEAFYTENEAPTQEAINALNSHMAAYMAGKDAGEWTDEIEYASRYEDKEWVAKYDAEDLYDAALRPWTLARNAIDLIDLIFSCIVAVRLCRGLLTSLRGGECTPHCLLSGWERISTAAWLSIKMSLRVLGWTLIPLVLSLLLYIWFGSIGELIGLILTLLVAYWAELHYSLAEVHLADDQDGGRIATDCLRFAVDDMDLFTIRAMLRTIWPIYVLIVVSVLFAAIAAFVPALSIPADMISASLLLVSLVLKYTCYVCVYDEMRQRDIAARDAIPANEGLARARALATEESPTE